MSIFLSPGTCKSLSHVLKNIIGVSSLILSLTKTSCRHCKAFNIANDGRKRKRQEGQAMLYQRVG